MSEAMSEIASKLGLMLKEHRQHEGLSQKQLAEGICSQAMVSSIERGTYVPNVILFGQLCSKLGITVSNQFLGKELSMNQHHDFSQHVFILCKNHQYAELIDYMDNSGVLDTLESDRDIQSFYYYYGCGIYQLSHAVKEAKRYLQLAAHVTLKEPFKPKTEIEILLINALAVMDYDLHLEAEAMKLFNTAYLAFQAEPKSFENLNVICYQYGYALYHQKAYQAALDKFLIGFDDVVEKESFFMLPEYALALTNTYEKLGNNNEAKRFQLNYQAFNDIQKARGRVKGTE